jgi:hypothetical protein
MNRLVLLIILGIAARADAGICIWRTTIAQGDSDYVWSTDENLPPSARWVLTNNETGAQVPIITSHWGRMQEDSNDAQSLFIPPSTPIGAYTLTIAPAGQRPQSLALAVVAPLVPTRQISVTSPGADRDASPTIQTAVNTAHAAGTMLQVNLAPGVYRINRRICLPPNVNVVGADRDTTILVRTYNADDAAYFSSETPLFTPESITGDTSGETLSDFTVDCSHDTSAVGSPLFAGFPGGAHITNMNFLRLRLIQAAGPSIHGMRFEDVEMVNSEIYLGSGSNLLKDVHWKGLPSSGNELILGGDQNVVINCSWDNTQRGIILRAMMGDSGMPTHSYFNSLTFSRIAKTANTGEVILLETTSALPMSDNVFSYVQYQGCYGPPVMFWNSAASNNHFHDFDSDRAGALALYGYGGAMQTGNVFRNFELRDGLPDVALNWGGKLPTFTQGHYLANNSFDGFAVIDPVPSMGMEFYLSDLNIYEPSHFGPHPSMFSNVGPPNNNTVTNLTVVGLPPGWSAETLGADQWSDVRK